MSPTRVIDNTRHELAWRESGGVEIALFWHTQDNTTTVDVHHSATGQTISFRVPPGQALDAFHHPFAHLVRQTSHVLAPDYVDDLRSHIR